MEGSELIRFECLKLANAKYVGSAAEIVEAASNFADFVTNGKRASSDGDASPVDHRAATRLE